MPSGKTAEKLVVQVDGTLIPVSIKELTEWGIAKKGTRSELGVWLSLLDEESQKGFLRILKAPLLKELSMGRQMLKSWAGRQLLDEVSDLLLVDEDSSGITLLNTLEQLLETKSSVSTLDLLDAIPAEKIRLDLDALFVLASRWRLQLKSQQKLSEALSKLPPTEISKKNRISTENKSQKEPIVLPLFVQHRSRAINLEIWYQIPNKDKKSSWILLMPGLGGSQNHFRWLARHLNKKGWSVVVLEHPGSDTRAVKALLEGRRAPPGAEVIPERILDLKAVILAKEKGFLKLKQENLVLMGHSLGALTALIAGGALPEPGLQKRCTKALDDLSLTNLSQFLQCQLNDVQLSKKLNLPKIKAIVALNSFGSLLWPKEQDINLDIPILLTGGTLDLITPPISEQLGLLLATKPQRNSRVVLVEGASHFSPIRIDKKSIGKKQADLFQLGEDLVGVRPLEVQNLLADEITIFLDSIENNKLSTNKSVHKEINKVRIHSLNRDTVKRLLHGQ